MPAPAWTFRIDELQQLSIRLRGSLDENPPICKQFDPHTLMAKRGAEVFPRSSLPQLWPHAKTIFTSFRMHPPP
jgi:hypothetical protein